MARRTLSFKTLDEAITEIESFRDREVKTHGVWSFYQILNHLALGAEWAMNQPSGFTPEEPGPAMKPSLQRKFFDRMVRTGKMKDGFQNPASPTVRVEGDAAAELERLLSALTELKNYSGPHPDHIVFGQLSTAEWQLWCAMHCAHHLGFAEPQ